MRRPALEPEVIEQPAPLLSFVLCESVLLRRLGGVEVLRGQLEHLLLVGRMRDVELQVLPLRCHEHAGLEGSFTAITREDSKKFEHVEAQGTSRLETDPTRVALASAKYRIIRSQALTPQESTE
ncbi:Scr1 family TA system antitoxin-like transcriptional regulator [Streptomyces sp. CL12]|uniref:Scr1 family TA system antitoxin-like transcriptional regulator n=1 Tax=Streptomyces sp. CL12 TaxID=3391744 RepID=UPI003A7FDD5E